MPFESYLQQNNERMDALVVSSFDKGKTSDIDRYLYGPLASYSSTSGKRHRPLICELACSAVGGNPAHASSAVRAIELFHTAALIHDDIADKAELRRGKLCLHLSEGEGLAINAGDVALTMVASGILQDDCLSDKVKLRVLDEFSRMALRTMEGQALDIGWARDARFDLTVEDYLMMATCKTAYYSGATPLAVGAIIGGGTEEEIKALRSFGLASGLAFQIQDDLLNLIGNEVAVGKDFRSDITEGKRTFVAVHALQNSKHADELKGILVAHTALSQEVTRAVEIMQEAGSIDSARAYSERLIAEAKTELIREIKDSEPRKLLLSMADFFVQRLR